MYAYDPDLKHICQAITGNLKVQRSRVVAISGFGGSGKSTLAQVIAHELKCPIVCIDAFGTAAVRARSSDWAGLDRERLVRQVLGPIKRGERRVNYDSCDDWCTWHTVPVSTKIGPVVIVEGVGILHPDIEPYFDCKVWLDVDLKTATAQGIARELCAGRDEAQVWTDVWEPNDADFYAKYKPRSKADLIVRLS